MKDNWLMSFTIKIADVVIRINSSARFSLYEFRDFLTSNKEEFTVEIYRDDLVINSFVYEENYVGWNGTINLSILHQKVAEMLILYDTILMHGATIGINNGAMIFTAPSGTGKTTHIRKWLEQIPDTFVINGDKPFIKFLDDDSQPLACGSPWAGKEGWFSNAMLPLKAIICMERAEENRIIEINFSEAFPFLLQQIYRPDDEEKMRKTIRLLQRLNGKVRFYKFQCNNYKDDCFEVAYSKLALLENVE